MATNDSKTKFQNVTVSGITVSVNPDSLDDYELVERLHELHEGQDYGGEFVEMVKAVLGDQYQSVKDELKKQNDGKLTVTKMGEFIDSISVAVNALKN